MDPFHSSSSSASRTNRNTTSSNSFLNSFHIRRSNNNHNRSSSSGSSRNNNNQNGKTTNNTVIQTEMIAKQALERNQVLFQYPTNGFITKIEYSLLYTMMNHPDVYPSSTIYTMMKSENYIQYIYVNTNRTTMTTTTTNNTTNSNDDTDPICSYAQLSALLALAAEKWPPPSSSSSSTDGTTVTNGPSRRNYDDDDVSNNNNNNSTTNIDNYNLNIVQLLCQILIQTIVRHAEIHQLDRETEINELFIPFQRVTTNKANQSAIMAIVPAYIGMATSIITGGNPIPFYIGYMMSINAIINQEKELANFKQVAQTTTRMSNVETTNLLYDTDDAMIDHHHNRQHQDDK